MFGEAVERLCPATPVVIALSGRLEFGLVQGKPGLAAEIGKSDADERLATGAARSVVRNVGQDEPLSATISR